MLRILIVGDSADTAELLQLMSAERSYSARAVHSRSAETIAVVSQFAPHIVIAEFMMPGMPLEQFFAAVQLFDPQIEFVIMSSKLTSATILTEELGIPLLTKPIEPSALYEILERITGSGEHAGIL